MNKEKFISTSELGKMLGISRVAALKLINKLEKERGIKPVQVGRTLFIEKSLLPADITERISRHMKDVAKKAAKVKPGKELSFEKELWNAADKLRGSVDASEYKHIVLGLVFLKYTSDAYYDRRAKLEKWTSDPKNERYYAPSEAAREAIVEDKDQYKGEGYFYIPEVARWEYLRERAARPDIGQLLDAAMDGIEKENPKQLKGVLPKIYARSPLEPHVLGELVNIFSRIKFDHDLDKEKDILGRVYEYFLGQFASAEGKRGGEFFTPPSVVRLLVLILKPFENARVFDPACGSGGMFVQSRNFMKEIEKDPTKLSFFGQEYNPTTWRLCKMNLAIRGIHGQIEQGNSYTDDKFPDLRADLVIANPPFNADWDPSRLDPKDPRVTKYGLAPKSNANFMWIEHFIHHLAPNGMAGFVMANGALAVGGQEGEIRKKMIEDDLMDVIIACPPKLFYNVALPVSLWFMTKDKQNGRFRKRTGETLFIDARELFEPVSKKQVVFTQEYFKKILGAVRSWRGEEGAGKYEDIAGFCKAATKEEIAKNGYVLTPGRYVGIAEEEDDGVPFEEKMQTLGAELKGLFDESRKLETEIEKNLKTLGMYDAD